MTGDEEVSYSEVTFPYPYTWGRALRPKYYALPSFGCRITKGYDRGASAALNLISVYHP